MTSFLDYAARGKTAWWRYPAACALALTFALLLGVGLSVALLVTHAMPTDVAAELQRPTHPAVFFLSTGLMFGSLLIAFAAAIRLVHHKRFTDVTGWWDWRLVCWGAGVWLAVQIAATLIDTAIAPQGFRLTADPATVTLAIWAIPTLALQSFAEEFVFRGYVTQGLLLWTRRPILTALASGLLFGSLHIPNGAPQAVNATVFGVATALIAIRTGGIAFTWGLHLVNNLFGAIVVVSARDVFGGSPGLFSQDTPGLIWWDVLVATVALLAVSRYRGSRRA